MFPLQILVVIIIPNGIESFFKRNIMRLQPEPTDRISFVGSVAYNLQETIKQVAALYGLQTGVFLKDPMDGLVQYHIKGIINK